MAFRAGVRCRRRASGIIAVGGDVPPELPADAALRFPAYPGAHEWTLDVSAAAASVVLARLTR